tara:strand:- start:58 stop:243 length:186 start_codon:yes stop_codon:yes gene_type:complete
MSKAKDKLNLNNVSGSTEIEFIDLEISDSLKNLLEHIPSEKEIHKILIEKCMIPKKYFGTK